MVEPIQSPAFDVRVYAHNLSNILRRSSATQRARICKVPQCVILLLIPCESATSFKIDRSTRMPDVRSTLFSRREMMRQMLGAGGCLSFARLMSALALGPAIRSSGQLLCQAWRPLSSEDD